MSQMWQHQIGGFTNTEKHHARYVNSSLEQYHQSYCTPAIQKFNSTNIELHEWYLDRHLMNSMSIFHNSVTLEYRFTFSSTKTRHIE